MGRVTYRRFHMTMYSFASDIQCNWTSWREQNNWLITAVLGLISACQSIGIHVKVREKWAIFVRYVLVLVSFDMFI